MSAVAKLQAVLGLDEKQYMAGMKSATGGAKDFQKQISNVGRAIGAAFSVAAIISAGKALISWASEISTAANNVGILTSEMIALTEAAVQNGLKTENANVLLARLEGGLGAAAMGTKELNKIYGVLGITLKDLFSGDMDPVKRFHMVGKAALESANPTAALAKIFGQQLGPDARMFVESMVDGLPKVTYEMGAMADEMRATGDAMEKLKQKSATTTLGLISDAQEGAAAFADLFGTLGWTASAPAAREAWLKGVEERQGASARKREAERIQLEKTKKDMADLIEKGEHPEFWTMERAAKINAYVRERILKANRNPADIEPVPSTKTPFVEKTLDMKAITRDAMERERGSTIAPDAMARVGGFLGGERTGYDVASKQLQVLQAIDRKMEEANRLAVAESDRRRAEEGEII